LLEFSAIFAEDVERDVEKDVDSSNEKSRQALEGPDRKRAKPIGHVPPRLTSAGLQGPSNLCGVIMGRSANQL